MGPPYSRLASRSLLSERASKRQTDPTDPQTAGQIAVVGSERFPRKEERTSENPTTTRVFFSVEEMMDIDEIINGPVIAVLFIVLVERR